MNVETSFAADFAVAAQELAAGLMRRPSIRAEIEREGFSGEAWDAIGEAGWAAVLLAEDAGGLGLGFSELGPIFTAIGRQLVPGPLLEHAIVLPLMFEHFSPASRERLAGAVAGARRLAFADPAATGASPSAITLGVDGRLSGRLGSVRFADLADDLLVVAQDPTGIPLVAQLDARRDGVTIVAQPSLDPLVRYAEIRLAGVEVATGDRLTGAAALLEDVRASLRLVIGAELSGMATHALDLAAQYALQREQFGQPIGGFQAIQQILAEMAREVQGVQALIRDSLDQADRTPAARPIIGRVAKSGAARAGRAVVEDSLQVHGGIAFTIEHELHRYYKHTLALEALYGLPRELWRDLGASLLAPNGETWPTW
jgi:alkylation response protein AidB-like acyl-CoA dehydrogenase